MINQQLEDSDQDSDEPVSNLENDSAARDFGRAVMLGANAAKAWAAFASQAEETDGGELVPPMT